MMPGEETLTPRVKRLFEMWSSVIAVMVALAVSGLGSARSYLN